MSSVSVCPIEEVAPKIKRPMWFQLYVLKDRGFMQNALERAQAAGCSTLVFTVDMPVPGARYRDAHSGMSGPNAPCAATAGHDAPALGLGRGPAGPPARPGQYLGLPRQPHGPAGLHGLPGRQLRPSISWKDLEWIRDFWKGPMVIKGILDPEDAKDAVRFGADGIIVSNHGGRQLDGVLSSARAAGHRRRGQGPDQDPGRLGHPQRPGRGAPLALGADCAMIGRAFIYALATAGEAGVKHLLELLEKEMRVAMTLTSVAKVADITGELLAS
jgi:L-lactate dehydrogenase (cytochrome)